MNIMELDHRIQTRHVSTTVSAGAAIKKGPQFASLSVQQKERFAKSLGSNVTVEQARLHWQTLPLLMKEQVHDNIFTAGIVNCSLVI